jgi:hypothetical protein
MVLRLLFFIISIFFFISCDFISHKKTSLQNLNDRDIPIDYTTVDAYPLFAECKDLNVQEAQIQCFEDNLIDKLNRLIYLKTANTSTVFQDTAYVDLSIAHDYRIKIMNIQSTPNINEFLPELDSVLTASVNQLPSVMQPAIKRGIPVETRFKLPVFVTVK